MNKCLRNQNAILISIKNFKETIAFQNNQKKAKRKNVKKPGSK